MGGHTVFNSGMFNSNFFLYFFKLPFESSFKN